MNDRIIKYRTELRIAEAKKRIAARKPRRNDMNTSLRITGQMTHTERVLTSALFSILNVESAAKHGPIKGLDVDFHFNKVRTALGYIGTHHGLTCMDLLMESDTDTAEGDLDNAV